MDTYPYCLFSSHPLCSYCLSSSHLQYELRIGARERGGALLVRLAVGLQLLLQLMHLQDQEQGSTGQGWLRHCSLKRRSR